jgi:hypothetical protein
VSVVSLLFILPLSVLFLNESIGEEIIDMILPSITSGVLIAFDAMLSVSIVLLVVPIILFFALFLYIVFLYRPALIAVKKRLEITKSRWDQTVVTRPALTSRRTMGLFTHRSFGAVSKGMVSGCLRVLRVSYMYLQSLVVEYSRNGYEQRLELNRLRLNVWQIMNFPPYAQGYHNNGTITKAMVGSSSTSTSSLGKGHMDGFRPPIEIANMLPSPKLREFFLNRVQGLDVAKSMKRLDIEYKTKIINIKNRIEIRNEIKLKALILFEFVEASSLMRIHLSAASFSNSYLVSVSSLSKEFGSIWEILYPDGIKMTETERKECHELFNDWKSSQDYLYVNELVDNILIGVQKISFEIFEDWFLNDLSLKVAMKKTDRLLDHVSHTGPEIQLMERTKHTEAKFPSLSYKKFETMQPLSAHIPSTFLPSHLLSSSLKEINHDLKIGDKNNLKKAVVSTDSAGDEKLSGSGEGGDISVQTETWLHHLEAVPHVQSFESDISMAYIDNGMSNEDKITIDNNIADADITLDQIYPCSPTDYYFNSPLQYNNRK